MVLPTHLRQRLTPAEIQFLCENENVTILPRYSMPKVELIGNKIPALKALKRVEVPLWTAIILKSQAKCNIIAPLWLNTDYLKKMYEQEKKNLEMFSSLPWNWLEMSKILIARAADDLSDSSTQLRSIIKDLREIRQLKSKRGLRELNESNIQLNGLSLMELNELRPFALSVMEKMRQLHDSVQTTNDQASDESEPDL